MVLFRLESLLESKGIVVVRFLSFGRSARQELIFDFKGILGDMIRLRGTPDAIHKGAYGGIT